MDLLLDKLLLIAKILLDYKAAEVLYGKEVDTKFDWTPYKSMFTGGGARTKYKRNAVVKRTQQRNR